MSDLFPGFDQRLVTTVGAEIFLRIGGAGPPLVLLHGYPQTHAMWHRITPALAEHFTVVLPDLRGYGTSSCPPNDVDNFTYSKRAMAQDILQVMNGLGFPRFMIVGHDRGARVGYRLAIDEPHAVSRLALLDIIPTYNMWTNFTPEFAYKIYHWLFLAQPHPLPEMLIEQRYVAFLDYTIASLTKTRDLSAFDERALAEYRSFISIPERIHSTCNDYRAGRTYDFDADKADYDAGRKITCPVQVLWGDTGVPDAAGKTLAIWEDWAEDLRGGPIDSGHFIPEENPDAMMSQLLPFLLETSE